MPRRAFLLAALALTTVAVVGCGADDPAATAPGARSADARSAAAPPADGAQPTTTAGGRSGGPVAPSSGKAPAGGTAVPGAANPAGEDAVPAPPRDWTATCPTKTTSPLGCRGVRGRVLTIQSLDPDGDGDLHVVAVGGDVTAPGITVFDVRPSLRPARDPVKGEYVTGAGPVFRGSFGQRQIQVDTFRVWRPRDEEPRGRARPRVSGPWVATPSWPP